MGCTTDCVTTDGPRGTPCPCRTFPSLVALFGIVVPLVAQIPFRAWNADRAAFSWADFDNYLWANIFMWFSLFSLFLPVFMYWQSGLKVVAWPVTLFSLYQALSFFYSYNFLPFIPAEVAKSLKFHALCTTNCGVSGLITDIRFEYGRPAEQQLIEDAAWCAISAMIIVVIESDRWSLKLPLGIPVWLYTVLIPVIGYDVMMPAFLIVLWNAESSGAKPKPASDLRYFYLVLGVVAMVLWIPHFWNVSWEIWTGRYVSIPQNAFGTRAFFSVYAWAIALAFYMMPSVRPLMPGGRACPCIPLWIMRVLFVWFMCSTVVGSWTCLWYFREQTPNRSFKISRDLPSVNGENDDDLLPAERKAD